MTRTVVALLRGINVGPHKRIAMADLRLLLGDLAYRDVRTVLQSGNAVFSTDADIGDIPAAIEAAIGDRFRMQVRCIALTGEEFLAAAKNNPFEDDTDLRSRMLALFFSAKLDRRLLLKNDPTELAPAEVRLGSRVIYQWCPDGVLAAPAVASFVEKTFGVAVTGRNWNTVLKLAASLSGK